MDHEVYGCVGDGAGINEGGREARMLRIDLVFEQKLKLPANVMGSTDREKELWTEEEKPGRSDPESRRPAYQPMGYLIGIDWEKRIELLCARRSLED